MEIIEKLVQQRKIQQARKSIRVWLNEQGVSFLNVRKAVEWYRRLSLYTDAISLLLKLDPLTLRDQKFILLIAETLSLLGANTFALKLINSLSAPIGTEHDYDITAGIYLSSGYYEKALMHFQQSQRYLEPINIRAYILNQLNCADCHARMKQTSTAIRLVKTAMSLAEGQSLLQAICLTAMGEYHARKKNFHKAIEFLSQAKEVFESIGVMESFDYALFLKWYGYVIGQTSPLKGTTLLSKSTLLMKKSRLSEDQWIENYILVNMVKRLEKNILSRIYFLNHFLPAPSVAWEKKQIVKIGNEQSRIKIYLSSREYSLGNSNSLYLPKELELAALLRGVENWGLALETIKSLLWPEEVFSYLNLEARLFQLVNRLRRKYKLEVFCLDRRLFLDKKDHKKIFVHVQNDSCPLFLKRNRTFSTRQLAKFYGIKKNQCSLHLQVWLANGWISKSGESRNTRYIRK